MKSEIITVAGVAQKGKVLFFDNCVKLEVGGQQVSETDGRGFMVYGMYTDATTQLINEFENVYGGGNNEK